MNIEGIVAYISPRADAIMGRIGEGCSESIELTEAYQLVNSAETDLSFHYEKKLSASDIAFVAGISERLVIEYQALYERYSCSHRRRLREIVSLAKDPPKLEIAKKGGTQK